MVCDEVWTYDEARAVATLTGLRLLCTPCDQVTHFGFTGVLGLKEQAIVHLATINAISVEAAQRVVAECFEVWSRQGGVEGWTVQVEPALLDRFPDLATLAGSGARTSSR